VLFIFKPFIFQSFFNTSNIVQGPRSPLQDNDCTVKFDFNDDHNEVLFYKQFITIHKSLINQCFNYI